MSSLGYERIFPSDKNVSSQYTFSIVFLLFLYCCTNKMHMMILFISFLHDSFMHDLQHCILYFSLWHISKWRTRPQYLSWSRQLVSCFGVLANVDLADMAELELFGIAVDRLLLLPNKGYYWILINVVYYCSKIKYLDDCSLEI